MARPAKQGLDYFPMDVTTDDKFELIEAKYGLVGFAIIVKLYQKIYREGYYLPWDDSKLFLFKKSTGEDLSLIRDIIDEALKIDIFNIGLFLNFGVLTSAGIQKRFFSACSRRKSIEIVSELVIVTLTDINAAITTTKPELLQLKAYIGTQSKVKESIDTYHNLLISSKHIYSKDTQKPQNFVKIELQQDFVETPPQVVDEDDDFISNEDWAKLSQDKKDAWYERQDKKMAKEPAVEYQVRLRKAN